MMTFSETLDMHINALINRDLETFQKTLVPDDRLSVILPNGSRLAGFNDIIHFHKTWFSDPDWSLELKLLSNWSNQRKGCATFQVNYADIDPTGKAYQLRYLLSLIFINENENWLLVLDQNTILPEVR